MEEKATIYSFSRLSSFDECKYCYYLNYVMPKDQRPPNEDNAFNLYGSFVHELLEKFSKGELASWDLLDKYVDEFDIQVNKEFPPNAFADLHDSYYNDGYAFLEGFEGFDDEYETLGVEQPFVVDFGDFKLRGFIDLILRDKKTGGIVVLDWKSKSKFASKKEQSEYARQPYLYSKYIYETYGVWPEKLRFYMFRKDTIVDIPFSMAGYEEAVTWARTQVQKIESKIKDDDGWPYRDDIREKDGQLNFFCNFICGYRNSCQYAKEVRDEFIAKVNEIAGVQS